MGRKQMATVSDVEAMASKCLDVTEELNALSDSLDRSLHDEALTAGVTVESARAVNSVMAAAAVLNVKLLALIAMRELRKGDGT